MCSHSHVHTNQEHLASCSQRYSIICTKREGEVVKHLKKVIGIARETASHLSTLFFHIVFPLF